VYYVPSSDYAHALDLQHRVNLALLRRFEQEAISVEPTMHSQALLMAAGAGALQSKATGIPAHGGLSHSIESAVP